MCLTSCKHSKWFSSRCCCCLACGLVALLRVRGGDARHRPSTVRRAALRWLPRRRLRGVLSTVRCHVRLSQRPPARYIQRPEAQPRLPVPTHRYWVTTCNESARRGFDNGLQRAVPKATSANFGPERAPRLRLRRGGGGGDLDRLRDLLRVRIGPSRCCHFLPAKRKVTDSYNFPPPQKKNGKLKDRKYIHAVPVSVNGTIYQFFYHFFLLNLPNPHIGGSICRLRRKFCGSTVYRFYPT